jgi:enoyl-CoA hydratase/carnithine racemase
MSTSSVESLPILVSQNKQLLIVELNRPKALNALSLEMCNQIKTLLLERINSENSTVGAFLLKGSGEKAFCAGGDVKSIWQELINMKNNQSTIGNGKPGFLHTDFFRQEYIMNYLLGTSLKPQISIWNGIVMGGGVGVSVLGEFRVATEKSMFAMPETAIGLFPDVGSSAWLPHLADGYGNYIGTL